MKETRPYVDWKLMGDFMTAVFVKLGVPVSEGVQKEFIALRDEFGLNESKFPFEK